MKDQNKRYSIKDIRKTLKVMQDKAKMKLGTNSIGDVLKL